MCDNIEEFPTLIKRLNLADEVCKNCQGENGAPVILIRNDSKPMCKLCFLSSSIHKFRSEFGKTQIVRQGEKLLVGFSGGPSSMAMLKLIVQGLSENEFRKLRFSPVFLHIYDNEEILKDIEETLSKTGFPYHLISVSDLKDSRLKNVNKFLNNKKLSTASKTAKNILLRSILSDLAKVFQCSRVLMASNCSRQSVRVLSNIAQGSGSYDDTCFHDTRHSMSILQPMRQFSSKEIVFVNRFLGPSSPVPFATNEETGTDKTFSIDRLTEEFVASLTSDFPSTIFTISRTAEKMKNIANECERKHCRFCGNVYKSQLFQRDEATAANAMAFSFQLLSGTSSQVNSLEANDDLCYTCQAIQMEINVPLRL